MKTRDARIEILTDLESKVKYSLEMELSGATRESGADMTRPGESSPPSFPPKGGDGSSTPGYCCTCIMGARSRSQAFQYGFTR